MSNVLAVLLSQLPMIFLKFLRIFLYGSHLHRIKQSHRLINMSNFVVAAATDPLPAKYIREPNVLRKKLTSVVPGTVNLQVLGNGANGSPSSIYLFTDQARYLFNCGEGTQRLAHEHRTRLSRLEQIFVTRNTWSAVGGLPGLALTIQDAGVRQVGLHGPAHLSTMLQSMRRFVVLKNLQIHTNDCSQGETFEDSVLKVEAVPIKKSIKEGVEQIVVSYICQLKPRPGALNLVKCVEHGLKPGPLMGQLKNGQDITLPDGRVVRSVDVTEPAERALSFVFLDVPDKGFLPTLLEQTKIFKDLGKTQLSEVAVVIHFTPHNVSNLPEYQEFLVESFSQGTQNIYLNSGENNFSGYAAAHRIQYQLNQLNPQIFPLLQEQTTCSLSQNLKKTKLVEEDNSPSGEGKMRKDEAADGAGVVSMTSFHLRPRKCLDRSLEVKLTPKEYIKETHAVPGFTELLAQLKSKPESVASNTYPRVIFLGTGSCIPNKTRNVSSILMQTSLNGFILLDCGEGTYGQIIRFFGQKRAEEVLQQLQLIYVSHLHADHHMGLIGLLRKRKELFPQLSSVLLLAPRQIELWLQFYHSQIEDIAGSFTLVPNGELLQQALSNEKLPPLGIKSISTCLVRHCPNAFGISLLLEAKYESEAIKVTYSGDTMPCSDLIELGRDSTILIHEATMEDDLEEEARIKTHSTISQAIQQGREMRAKHTILTHFSQRYAKCPRLPSVDDMKHVAIAFDNMQVTIEDLQGYYKLYPALMTMYAEYTEELEQRALKRELKQERKRKLADT